MILSQLTFSKASLEGRETGSTRVDLQLVKESDSGSWLCRFCFRVVGRRHEEEIEALPCAALDQESVLKGHNRALTDPERASWNTQQSPLCPLRPLHPRTCTPLSCEICLLHPGKVRSVGCSCRGLRLSAELSGVAGLQKSSFQPLPKGSLASKLR